MTEAHISEDHGSAGVKPYFVIFGALVIFTLVSFLVNWMVRGEKIDSTTGFTIILAVAVCKAVLVALFFMHLKFDWGRLYFMIVPALVLGALLVIVLWPDMVLAWHHGPAYGNPAAIEHSPPTEAP